MRLADAAWTDVADLETELAVVPVGSHEQHGPHLPLATDTLIAEAVADAAVDEFDGEVLIAPPLSVGIAEEHRAFAGTLWTAPATFRDSVMDVLKSLAEHGFTRAVIVNGHGGNTAAVAEVASKWSRRGEQYATTATWFEMIDLPEPMGHAGPVETAMIRHHHPTLVKEDRVAAAARNSADRWGDWVNGINLAHDSHEFTSNGVVGDPRAGSADLGQSMTEAAAVALADLLSAVESRDHEPA